jgi:hypothetical protein
MRNAYTAQTGQASALDEIAGWIGQHPDRVGVYAFLAARLIERDRLPYGATFDRVVRAAMDAGRSEAAARTQTFRGFAFAAAGYIEPPVELSEGDG